jgi:4-hydroxy-2-oxoheptanedioate aldolase
VSTREEAERIVRAALFAPRGMRGDGFFSRQSHGVEDYFERVNDEVMLAILLEDVHAIENLDDILEVPHIDFYYVGASDLAQTMGHLGNPKHPEVQSVVEHTIKRILAKGHVAGTTVNDSTVEHFMSLGCRYLRWDAMPYMYDGLRNFQARVQSALPGETQ